MRLHRNRFRGCLLGGAVGDALGAPVETRLAYLRWLRTQRETPGPVGTEAAELDGWLIQQRELHQRRAPGYSCLTALREPPPLDGTPVNESKGCGGVMRVAPVGLFLWLPGGPRAPHHAFRLAGALAATRGILAQHPEHEETLHAMLQAESLAASRLAPAAAITKLGQGWLAEEALAIAIYCTLVARSFRDGVILAVNHDGDSDSTGSIAGNLLGAMHGVDAIPAEWLEPLELRHVITQVADDLYDYRDWDIGEHSANQALNEQVWNKYPGC